MLFIVGKLLPAQPGAWEFVGVFDSELLAIDACLDEQHFIGPATLNQIIVTTQTWPGCYFPLAPPTREAENYARS